MKTIAAVATAPGRGAIGIVRISGPAARTLLSEVFVSCSPNFSRCKPWVLHRGRFRARDGSFLDDVLAVYMPAPKTYTGEDMAEVHCHGSPVIQSAILERLFELGATPAEPGEFSKRAYLNGRMDLSQAEAVAELVAARSPRALRETVQRLDGLVSRQMQTLRSKIDRLRADLVVAVDFPEEETECLSRDACVRALQEIDTALAALLAGKKRAHVYQEGASVVLLGAVNAGKSRLMNVFLGRERALVTDIPGTTRDYLEELCTIDGVPLRIIDTAGIRATLDPVEQLGIARGRDLSASADCLLILFDASTWPESEASACPDPAYAELLAATEQIPRILVWNKKDLRVPAHFPPAWVRDPAICVSCETGEGIPELGRLLCATILGDASPSAEYVAVNMRQAKALEDARKELSALLSDVRESVPYDLCAVRLDVVANLLGEVIGCTLSSDVLNSIFDRFCIGK